MTDSLRRPAAGTSPGVSGFGSTFEVGAALSGQPSGSASRPPVPGRAAREGRAVLSPSGQAPREARNLVTGWLRDWSVPEPTLSNVELSVSELVSNAVEHGTGEIGLEARLAGTRLLLRVRDSGGQAPVAQSADHSTARGRGLLIVAALSTGWGYQAEPDGKWVWAEFPVPDEMPDKS